MAHFAANEGGGVGLANLLGRIASFGATRGGGNGLVTAVDTDIWLARVAILPVLETNCGTKLDGGNGLDASIDTDASIHVAVLLLLELKETSGATDCALPMRDGENNIETSGGQENIPSGNFSGPRSWLYTHTPRTNAKSAIALLSFKRSCAGQRRASLEYDGRHRSKTFAKALTTLPCVVDNSCGRFSLSKIQEKFSEA